MDIFFERGTIIIESEGPLPFRPPEGFLWDPRVRRWRAEAHRLPGLLAGLEERGVAYGYHSLRPRQFAPERLPPERLPRLRPYQLEALSAWTAARRRGLICLPTGSGKTRVAVRAMLELGRPALVVAPTRELVHQWVAALRESYPGAVGRYGDGERELEPFTVATYESAHIHLDRFGDHFDLLVVDEAHHLASERWGEIARMAVAAFRLGLSATPPEPGARRQALEEVLGPVCFALPVARLSGSYLSTLDLKVILLRLSPGEGAEYRRHHALFLLHWRPFIQQNPGASWTDFVRAASRSSEGREALAALRRSRRVVNLPRSKLSAIDQLLDEHRDQPTLVFTADNRSAYELSKRFLIPAITCETDREERRAILGRFEGGGYRALVSAKVLNEGIDVPAASVAVVAGGTSSPVEHAQRIGRVLRPLPGKRALVYELVVSGTAEWMASERRNRCGVPRIPPSL